jgi:molecular chaperone DnaK (HSP70)
MPIKSSQCRYAVGIDLGTTHCVLSYIDLHSSDEQLIHQIMPIPQLTSPGSIEERMQLPSFIYQAHASELTAQDIVLPWSEKPDIIIGTIARELGSKTPIRLVSSAKSWLCHSGIDRHAEILPINSPDEVDKVSPIEATYHYLSHLRDAWDYRFPQAPLVDQDVTITVPASFDPSARELTAEAAESVGFEHITLLEEPQAALYSWIKNSDDNWRKQVSVGDVVLVIDIGGGTTDLSLVAVTEEAGELSLNRVAVGDHILLGGDNMDLALAYRLKAKLAQEGKNLQPWQVHAITHACRDAKEALLSDSKINSVAIVVPSRGSKLLGSTLRTELTREEVSQTIIEGFFPHSNISDHPVQQARSALTQIGLPYAQDAAVPRHLAAFLCRQQDATSELLGNSGDDFIKPTAILFNGGVLKAPLIAERVISTINNWLVKAGAEPAKLLEGVDLDLAVASGAAYYGYVRGGKGVRIRGGLASAYYVGVESSMPAIPGMEPPLEALCVAPFGMEEGSEASIPNREFGLVVGEPVSFRFFGSTTRREDSCGTLLDYWEPDELEELPEIQATLPLEGRTAGQIVAVKLAARVSEVGTLRLEAIPREGDERWQIEFDVRKNSISDENS